MGNCSDGTSVSSVSNGGWGKWGVVPVVSGGSSFLLSACRSLTGFFSVESLKGFFQEYPRYFEGVPLSYKKFVFDVSDHTTRDMAESEVVDLSKSEGTEYSYEVFLFGFTTFSSGEIGVQGVRCFREASSNVTHSRHAYR